MWEARNINPIGLDPRSPKAQPSTPQFQVGLRKTKKRYVVKEVVCLKKVLGQE